jgi:hypothetical protein
MFNQYDLVFFDKEIENITNKINQYTRTRTYDQNLLDIVKQNFDKQKEYNDHL